MGVNPGYVVTVVVGEWPPVAGGMAVFKVEPQNHCDHSLALAEVLGVGAEHLSVRAAIRPGSAVCKCCTSVKMGREERKGHSGEASLKQPADGWNPHPVLKWTN